MTIELSSIQATALYEICELVGSALNVSSQTQEGIPELFAQAEWFKDRVLESEAALDAPYNMVDKFRKERFDVEAWLMKMNLIQRLMLRDVDASQIGDMWAKMPGEDFK